MKKVWNVIRKVIHYLFVALCAFLRALNPMNAFEQQNNSYRSYNRFNYDQPENK